MAVLLYASFRGIPASVPTARSAAAVVLALAIDYVVVPGLAVSVGPALLPELLFLGPFVVLAGPTTVGSAIVWTRADDGDVALTTIIAVVSVAASPLVVPALFAALRSTAVSLDPLAIGLDLLAVLAGGGVLKLLQPDDLIGGRTLDRVAVVAIASLVYVAVGTAGFAGARFADVLPIAGAVVLVDLVVLASAAIGSHLAGLSRPQRRSVVYAAGLKNLAIPLLVASSIDAGPALRIVLFYALEQFVGSIRAEAPAGAFRRARDASPSALRPPEDARAVR